MGILSLLNWHSQWWQDSLVSKVLLLHRNGFTVGSRTNTFKLVCTPWSTLLPYNKILSKQQSAAGLPCVQSDDIKLILYCVTSGLSGIINCLMKSRCHLCTRCCIILTQLLSQQHIRPCYPLEGLGKTECIELAANHIIHQSKDIFR